MCEYTSSAYEAQVQLQFANLIHYQFKCAAILLVAFVIVLAFMIEKERERIHANKHNYAKHIVMHLENQDVKTLSFRTILHTNIFGIFVFSVYIDIEALTTQIICNANDLGVDYF